MSVEVSKAQRILMLCPELGYGGAERSFAKVATLLSEQFDVQCVAFSSGCKQIYPIPVPVLFLDKSRSTCSFMRLLHRVIAFRRLVNCFRPDLVISFLEGADYINYLSGAPSRFASIRGSKTTDLEIRGIKGAFRRALMRFIYPRMEGVIPVSEGLAEEMRNTFLVPKAKIWVIGNFYDMAEIGSSAEESPIHSVDAAFRDFDVWSNVGRLHIQKNQGFLLKLLAHTKVDYPRARLALIGDGSRMPELIRMCQELGLRYSEVSEANWDASADIWFMGYQENPHALVARSRLFLFPSLYEGFPNALVEAMACGIPVVAADCVAGPSQILDVKLKGATSALGKGGVIACVPLSGDSADLDVWAQAIALALRKHHDLSESASARASDFSFEAAREEWKTLVRSATVARWVP